MFDLRYHVASLAAVFLVLVIGILVGVGISGPRLRRRRRARPVQRPDREPAGAGRRRGRVRRTTSSGASRRRRHFVESAYPVLVDRRLDGKRSRCSCSARSSQTLDFVERALSESDARAAGRADARARRCRSRLDAVESTLARRSPSSAATSATSQLGDLGRDLGRELAAGGETPLWDALAGELVEERSGDSREPADGVVVDPRRPSRRQGRRSRFLAGLYQGLGEHRRAGGRRRAGSGRAERDPGVPAPRPLDRRRDRHRARPARARAPARRRRAGRLRRPRHGEDGILPPIEPLPAPQ